eukprot:Skav209368  [mRNA]  locus=scaffold1388:204244:218121:- [translate_table: standard]
MRPCRRRRPPPVLHPTAVAVPKAFVKSFMAITDGARFSSKGNASISVEEQSSKKSTAVVAQTPLAQMKLAQTLERRSAPRHRFQGLSTPSKRRGRTRQNVQDKGPDQHRCRDATGEDPGAECQDARFVRFGDCKRSVPWASKCHQRDIEF